MKVQIKKEMKMEIQSVQLYHRRTDGGVKTWAASLNGTKVTQVWGVQGGRLQSTVHDVKGNDRQTAQERAEHRFKTLVEGRMKKGYVKNLAGVTDSVSMSSDKMNFDRLPRSFAPSKPFKSFDPDKMAEWEQQGLLIVQRKRDGMRHTLISDTTGKLHIYSSGKDDMTEHLWPLIQDLRLPPRSVLDVELVATNTQTDADDFQAVSSVARSLPKRAHRRIDELAKEGIQVQLMAFDLLWWKGDPLYKRTYTERYAALAGAVQYAMADLLAECDEGYPPLVRMPPVFEKTKPALLSKAIDLVKKHKWEGLVIWRRDLQTQVQMNGSPARCNCWKLKPVGEEDVIATGYELGKGRNSKVVGKLNIAVPGHGPGPIHKGVVLTPMGRCGTGLTDKDRIDALKWNYPCVIQIEYDQKSEKGFRFPVFIRKREDKKVTEVG